MLGKTKPPGFSLLMSKKNPAAQLYLNNFIIACRVWPLRQAFQLYDVL
jgi:hypothetical protein